VILIRLLCKFIYPFERVNASLLILFRSWGQSAGAMSVALQMLAYGGQTEGLFRGAFMQSGAPIPVSDLEKGQVSSLIK